MVILCEIIIFRCHLSTRAYSYTHRGVSTHRAMGLVRAWIRQDLIITWYFLKRYFQKSSFALSPLCFRMDDGLR